MGFLVNLNYLYFAILTTISLLFAFGKSYVVTNPLNKEQKLRLEGIEALWIVIFSTGLLALNVSGFIDLMAIRLFVIEGLCLLAIFMTSRHPILGWASALYIIYLIWLIIGCTYTSSVVYGIRVILKYLFPLLIMWVASIAVRNHEIFIKACLGAILFAILSIAFSFIPQATTLIPGVLWYPTARAIHYISLMILCLSFSYFTKTKWKYRFLALLFLSPCFIWVFRTSIFGSFVALSALFFIKYKLRALPIILSLFIVGILLIFLIPNLNEKMFKENKKQFSLSDFQEGRIEREDIETNARDVMWEYLYNKLAANKTMFGSGTGAVQNEMYSNNLFGGLKVPHNDYLQILCDNGIVGLVLYLSIALFIFIHCFIEYHKNSNIPIKICSLTAGASIMGVAITLYSDNAVNYSMTTLSMPYGFYGMLLGLTNNKNSYHL